MNILNKDSFEKNLPDKLYLTTSNGNFVMSLHDSISGKPSIIIAGPQIQISYYHCTVEDTADPLTDGEPDYLGIDLQIKDKGNSSSAYFDITYGDAMMFSFEVFPNNELKVGHYNGVGSKFDPNYIFYFQEESIEELLNFINSLNKDFKLSREKLNFLDGDKDSFKMEKVNHRRIVDFRSFNHLGLL